MPSNKNKSKKSDNNLKPPRAPRLPNAADMLREIYTEAGVKFAYPYKRKHSSDIERLLTAAGQSDRIGSSLTPKEQNDLEADLSALGLHPGRTQLTLPERLVLKWCLKAGLDFGGVFPQITNPGADFFSQYPLNGGRARSGGGTMVDVFISPSASKTAKGLALAVDGVYFHTKAQQAGRDATIDLLLNAQGYKTARITDTQVAEPGVLENFMSQLVDRKQ